MLISSVTRNEEGQIIEISESIYPLERNKFVWKLKL
jgi:DNA-binding GntR family transcriptional regulator